MTDTEETEPRDEIINSIQRDCESEDQPLVSPPCECICHLVNTTLVNPPNIEEVDEENTDDNSKNSGAQMVYNQVLDCDESQQLMEETSSVSSRLSTSSSSATGISLSACSIPPTQSMSAQQLVECFSPTSNESR